MINDATSTVYIGGIYEKGSDGSVRKYYQFGGRAVAMREIQAGGGAGTVYYLLADHLGSTVGLLDADGAKVLGSETKYWPYGATRSGAVAQTDLLFTFQREEPDDAAGLGLYNYKARFYSTVTGRFMRADPVLPQSASQGWNRYLYALGNPVRYKDPLGWEPTEQDLEACGNDIASCLLWSVAGDWGAFIESVAMIYSVPADILAAIILNEMDSWDIKDYVAEDIVCKVWCPDRRSIGIAQMKISTAQLMEELGYVKVAGSETKERLADDKWAIVYAAAYLAYGRDTYIVPALAQSRLCCGNYRSGLIIFYTFGPAGIQDWINSGACDTCYAPTQLGKVSAYLPGSVDELAERLPSQRPWWVPRNPGPFPPIIPDPFSLW